MLCHTRQGCSLSLDLSQQAWLSMCSKEACPVSPSQPTCCYRLDCRQRDNPTAWIQNSKWVQRKESICYPHGQQEGFLTHGTQPLLPILMDSPFCVPHNRIQSRTQCKQISRKWYQSKYILLEFPHVFPQWLCEAKVERCYDFRGKEKVRKICWLSIRVNNIQNSLKNCCCNSLFLPVLPC